MSTPAIDLFPKDKADVHTSARGTTYFWRPARGVLLSRVEGRLTLEAGLAMDALMRRVVSEDRRITAFGDWEDMTDYDTEVRNRLSKTVLELRASFESNHLLVKSRIVALGVQAANVVVKILTVHNERGPFEAALREVLHRQRA